MGGPGVTGDGGHSGHYLQLASAPLLPLCPPAVAGWQSSLPTFSEAQQGCLEWRLSPWAAGMSPGGGGPDHTLHGLPPQWPSCHSLCMPASKALASFSSKSLSAWKLRQGASTCFQSILSWRQMGRRTGVTFRLMSTVGWAWAGLSRPIDSLNHLVSPVQQVKWLSAFHR